MRTIYFLLAVLLAVILLRGCNEASGADWSFDGVRAVAKLSTNAQINRDGKVKSDPQKRPKEEPWKIWTTIGPHSLRCPSSASIPPHQAYSSCTAFSYTGSQGDLFLMSGSLFGLGIVALEDDVVPVSGTAYGSGVVANTGKLVLSNYGNAQNYTVTADLEFTATLIGTDKKSFNQVLIIFGWDGGINSQLNARYSEEEDKWRVSGNVFKYVNGAHENDLISDPLPVGWTSLNGYKKTHSHHAPVGEKCKFIIIVNSTESKYQASEVAYGGKASFADILTELGGTIKHKSTALK